MMQIRRMIAAAGCLGLGVAMWIVAGCGSESSTPAGTEQAQAPGAGTMEYCDFKQGPDAAPVKVVAFYPGRHEDTLAAVKGLLEKYPEKVQVEIVDWRHKEGRARRDEAGLTCAGVIINDQNAFDLTIDGKREKVMFVRGIDGDWTETHLVAAVEKELQQAGSDETNQPE